MSEENPEMIDITMTPEEVLVEMADKMVPKAQLEEAQQKYNDLFRRVANGMLIEQEAPAKTKAEKRTDFEAAVKDIGERKVHKPLEHMRRLLEIDDYLRENGERSCFEPSLGDLDEETEASAQRVHDLLQDVVDRSEGSDEVAMALLGNSLRDNIKLRR